MKLGKKFIIIGIAFLVIGIIILVIDGFLYGNPLSGLFISLKDLKVVNITAHQGIMISNITTKSAVVYNSTSAIRVLQLFPNGSEMPVEQRYYEGYYIAFVNPPSVLLYNNLSKPISVEYAILPIVDKLLNYLIYFTVGIILGFTGGVMIIIGIAFYIRKR
ncbi:MAG: hypothetical protein OWQ54_05100 [Sulfolobaceae archaeon]|nr:hypothetical protein [Sulfolobaceae archaeon]